MAAMYWSPQTNIMIAIHTVPPDQIWQPILVPPGILAGKIDPPLLPPHYS